MEEVIRLSGYEINQVQIKKKGTQLLFTIFVAGVIYGSGKIPGYTGKAGYDRIRTG